MKDGFLKAAALSPALRVADCAYNVRQITDALHKAAARGVKLAVFPEFCLTGYTCGDLFLQRTLQTGALDALSALLDETKALDVVTLVGLPLLVHGKLYNCAAVLCHGRILGLVPKTYLPNYGEFYEKRQFTPGSTEVETVTVCGQEVPFGTSLLFRCRQMPSFVLGVEICEDLWSALPPSTFHALAGATVIANLSAKFNGENVIEDNYVTSIEFPKLNHAARFAVEFFKDVSIYEEQLNNTNLIIADKCSILSLSSEQEPNLSPFIQDVFEQTYDNEIIVNEPIKERLEGEKYGFEFLGEKTLSKTGWSTALYKMTEL